MHAFADTRIVPCSASAIYAVVLDIERYPEFLPWVAEARILSRGEDELTAELVAELGGRRIAFRTVDRFSPGRLIEIRLLEGPFRFLDSVWSFRDLAPGRAEVRFSIEFAFSSRWLDLIAGPVFDAASRAMVQAFEARARAIGAQEAR